MPETTCVGMLSTNKGRHKFPKDEKRRQTWVQAIRRAETKFKLWSPSIYSYVCEKHFTEDDYHTSTYSGVGRKKEALRKTAVPSVFSWTCKKTLEKSKARKLRVLARCDTKRRLFKDLSNTREPEYVAQKLDIVINELDVGASEEIEPMEIEAIAISEPEIESAVIKADAEVQTRKLPAFSIHNFENDSVAVHFYTGLENYDKFIFVLDTIEPAAYQLIYIYHSVMKTSSSLCW